MCIYIYIDIDIDICIIYMCVFVFLLLIWLMVVVTSCLVGHLLTVDSVVLLGTLQEKVTLLVVTFGAWKCLSYYILWINGINNLDVTYFALTVLIIYINGVANKQLSNYAKLFGVSSNWSTLPQRLVVLALDVLYRNISPTLRSLVGETRIILYSGELYVVHVVSFQQLAS